MVPLLMYISSSEMRLELKESTSVRRCLKAGECGSLAPSWIGVVAGIELARASRASGVEMSATEEVNSLPWVPGDSEKRVELVVTVRACGAAIRGALGIRGDSWGTIRNERVRTGQRQRWSASRRGGIGAVVREGGVVVPAREICGGTF